MAHRRLKKAVSTTTLLSLARGKSSLIKPGQKHNISYPEQRNSTIRSISLAGSSHNLAIT